MRVLGVDPGTIRLGWGVIDSRGSSFSHVGSGVIVAGRGDVERRLALVQSELSSIIANFEPEALSIERNFLARNVHSAFRLGEARGVVLALAGAAGLELGQYSPATIKKAVTGSGRAQKLQVQGCVVRLLKMDQTPPEDAADALAAALCHLLSRGLSSKLSVARAQAKQARVSKGWRAFKQPS